MYSVLPSYILGFHGCDQEIGEQILAGEKRITYSMNEYDWLGHGAYFWENNPKRALEFAINAKNHPQLSKGYIKTPFVLGAVIFSGKCLNLLEKESLEIVRDSYYQLEETYKKARKKLPENKLDIKAGEVLLRNLDCAVIENLHSTLDTIGESAFDTVRGVFIEGERLYPGAEFRERTHIQVCVRNLDCIKGFFRPLPHTKYL